MAQANSIKYLHIALLMVGIAGQTGTLSAQEVTHLNPVIEKLAAGKPFIGFQTSNLSSENARAMVRADADYVYGSRADPSDDLAGLSRSQRRMRTYRGDRA